MQIFNDSHKLKTIIGLALSFILVFFIGFFAGSRTNGEGGPLSSLGDTETAKAEAKEAQPLSNVSRAVITPTATTHTEDTDTEGDEEGEEEEEAAVLPELTDEIAIVNTSSEIYTYDTMCEDMYALCGKYPGILTYTYVGTSFDDRNLYAITLGNTEAPHHIMAVASINGSEHMTTMLLMKMLEYYAYYYDVGTYEGVPFSKLFDNTSFRVLMMANPDGVAIAQQGISALNHDEFKEIVKECYEKDKWYLEYTESNGVKQWIDHYELPEFNVKLSENPEMISFEEYEKLWNANAYGVDISRNFDAEWENATLKADFDYAGFKGTAPMTEVETALIYSYAVDKECDYYINYTGSMSPVVGDTDSGSFDEWIKFHLGKECIRVSCGNGPAPFNLYDFEDMYEENRDSWAHLAYGILDSKLN